MDPVMDYSKDDNIFLLQMEVEQLRMQAVSLQQQLDQSNAENRTLKISLEQLAMENSELYESNKKKKRTYKLSDEVKQRWKYYNLHKSSVRTKMTEDGADVSWFQVKAECDKLYMQTLGEPTP